MRCQVLIGTRDTYRPCDLPARRVRNRNVCTFHRAYHGRLPFDPRQLPTHFDVVSGRKH